MSDSFSKADELRKLKDLLDDGVITPEEFDIQKKTVLNPDFLSSTSKPSTTNTPSPTHTAAAPQHSTFPPKPQKKRGCLLPFLILFGVCAALASVISQLSSTKPAISSSSVSEASEPSGASVEPTKAEWLEFDAKSWEDFCDACISHNSLLHSMSEFAEGRVGELDFYNYCKDAEEYFMNASQSYTYGKNEDENKYLSVLESLALSDQIAVKKLIKYIDTKQTKYLSEAGEEIQRAKEAATLFASNRGTLLVRAGLTQEELETKVSDDLDALDKEVQEKTAPPSDAVKSSNTPAPTVSSSASAVSEEAVQEPFNLTSNNESSGAIPSSKENVVYLHDVASAEKEAIDRFALSEYEFDFDEYGEDYSNVDLDGIS